MSEEMIKLREDNQRLQNMCSVVQQMNDMLSKAMNECKCFCEQTLTNKFNVLKHKYQELKDTTICGQSDKLTSVSTQTDHTVTKEATTEYSTDETMNQMLASDESNVLPSNDKQNHLLTIETIDDSLYKGIEEEINLEFVFPKIESNEDHFQQFIESKTIENKNKIVRKKSKRLKGCNQLKGRSKQVCCVWPGCHMKFRDSYNMSVHMLRHTGHKSFVCCNPGCDKSYATKAALDTHHNTHLDNRRFKCPYCECGAAFIRKTQLDVHISQNHTLDFPYKCNWPGCEYQGCYLNRLNSHRLSHTGIKPFKCEWKGCDASFRLNHHLKAHMLKHTGEKPISCQLSACDKRFQSKQAMKIHFQRTHSKPTNHSLQSTPIST